jgi:hypothetical protein
VNNSGLIAACSLEHFHPKSSPGDGTNLIPYAQPIRENALTVVVSSKRLRTESAMVSPKTRSKQKSKGTLSKGISIDPILYRAALTKAQRESRSFSFIVCQAIKRDLQQNLVTEQTPLTPDPSPAHLDLDATPARSP